MTRSLLYPTVRGFGGAERDSTAHLSQGGGRSRRGRLAGPITQQSWQPRVLISARSRCCKPGCQRGVHSHTSIAGVWDAYGYATKDMSGSNNPFVQVEFSLEIVN